MEALLLRICKWDQYQARNDKALPWCKLHRKILRSSLMDLEPETRWVAVGLMALAVEQGRGPGEILIPSTQWLHWRLHTDSPPDLKALESIGFIEVCEVGQNASEVRPSRARPRASTSPSVSREEGESEGGKGFDAFWVSYPRKVGKRDAQKAWRQTAGERPPFEQLCEALERLKASRQWRKDGGQYVPYPATWLRRGGWDDEPDDLARSPEEPPPPPIPRHDEADEIWQGALEKLRAELDPHTFSIWLRPTYGAGLDPLVVAAPNKGFLDWLESNRERLERAVGRGVEFVAP